MLISQEQEALRLAAVIAQNCQLADIRMCKARFAIDHDESELTPPFSLRMKHETEASVDASILKISADFKIETADSSKPKKSVFIVECNFLVSYRLKAGFTPAGEQISAFKDGNAIYNCWPYVREFVQNATTRMGLEVPPIPLLKIAPKAASAPDAKRDEAGVESSEKKAARSQKAEPRKKSMP